MHVAGYARSKRHGAGIAAHGTGRFQTVHACCNTCAMPHGNMSWSLERELRSLGFALRFSWVRAWKLVKGKERALKSLSRSFPGIPNHCTRCTPSVSSLHFCAPYQLFDESPCRSQKGFGGSFVLVSVLAPYLQQAPHAVTNERHKQANNSAR
jgi:hypothetical protein